jgi:glutaredoxin
MTGTVAPPAECVWYLYADSDRKATRMIELYQAEWCPDSHKVRQRLTELGVPFIARQVAVDRGERTELRERTGEEGIPTLVLEDGSVVGGEAEEIIARLDSLYTEGPGAAAHRAKAAS